MGGMVFIHECMQKTFPEGPMIIEGAHNYNNIFFKAYLQIKDMYLEKHFSKANKLALLK